MRTDDGGFNKFYARAYARIRNFSRSRASSREDAEEITNEAFARLWQRWEERRGLDDNLNVAWLYKAVGFIALEYACKNPPKTESIDGYADALPDASDGIAASDENAQYERYLSEIRKILGGDYDLFELIFIKEIPYRDAA